jgi:hypothetical protein
LGVLLTPYRRALEQCGVLISGYGTDADRLPLVVLLQLWCFRDLDPLGVWLDSAALTITRLPDGKEEVQFTDALKIKGEPVMATGFGDSLREHECAKVVRLGVIPSLGLAYPDIDVPGAGTYEIVSPPDVHIIRTTDLPPK